MTFTFQILNSRPDIGLRARRPRLGPEQQLTKQFLEHVHQHWVSEGTQCTVFLEPSIDSRFPDMVLVEYDPSIFINWSENRSELEPGDLKVVQHLYQTQGLSSALICKHLGLDGSALLQSLERLIDSGLVCRSKGKWQPTALEQVFAIKRLIAVEAKISDWRAALGQAAANRWFASETYILSPVQRPSNKTLRQSERLGVGIYLVTDDGVEERVSAEKNPLPTSYMSWLFNEWIGRLMISS